MNSKIVQIVPHQGDLIALHEDGSLSLIYVDVNKQVTIIPLWQA